MAPNTTDTFRATMMGSICVFIGQLLFATNDAIIKLSNVKISQLLVGRSTVCIIIAVLWWLIKKPSTVKNWYGDHPYIKNIWIRGITYSIMFICLWYAIIRLPIGDVFCIFNQAPLLIAIIAAVFLKEKLPKMTPFIAVFAILGICFLSQPTFLTHFYYRYIQKEVGVADNAQFETLNIDGLLSIFVAMISWSICVVLVRTAKESHFLQLELVSALQTVFIAGPVLLLLNEYAIKNDRIGDFSTDSWKWDIKSIVIIIIVGINGFIALCLNVVGFQYGDATKVAWLEYIETVFTLLYQIFLFNDIPNTFEITGAVLVVIACCISVGEEIYNHRKSKEVNYERVSVNSDLESALSEDAEEPI